jgi:predicted DNA binding CopG/RHH family protein
MVKNHELRVKLSIEELELIKRKANQLGLEPSVFLRMLGLSTEVPIIPFKIKRLKF